MVSPNIRTVGRGGYSTAPSSGGANTGGWIFLLAVVTFVSVQIPLQLRSSHVLNDATNQSPLPSKEEFTTRGRVLQKDKDEQDLMRFDAESQVNVTQNDLPAWMLEYFQWHRKQLATLTPETWTNHNYLIIRCLSYDKDLCGSILHRLQSIPLALSLGHTSQRIMFIRWEQPAMLEKYLQPTSIGLDWRLPDWLHKKFGNYDQYSLVKTNSPSAVERALDKSRQVVTMRHLTRDHGRIYYDKQRAPEANDLPYDKAFRKIFYAMFTPTEAVRSTVISDLKSMNLKDKAFVVAHVPTFSQKKINDQTQPIFRTAVNCAHSRIPKSTEEGAPRTTILVVTDSQKTVEIAMRNEVVWDEGNTPVTVVLRTVHGLLEFDGTSGHWQNMTAEDYYQPFAFWYILSRAQCAVYGAEGVGRLGVILSYNPLCGAKYKYIRRGFCFDTTDEDLDSAAPVDNK